MKKILIGFVFIATIGTLHSISDSDREWCVSKQVGEVTPSGSKCEYLPMPDSYCKNKPEYEECRTIAKENYISTDKVYKAVYKQDLN